MRGIFSGEGALMVGPRTMTGAAGAGSTTRVRVLLVDDHKLVREGIAALLSDDHRIMVVGQAAGGEEALKLARDLNPDVVLMDVSMPGMDGIETTRRMREILRRARVIGLSVRDDHETISAMSAAGAVAYLNKDGDPQDLVDTILATVDGPS